MNFCGGIYLGIELLDYVIITCLTFWWMVGFKFLSFLLHFSDFFYWACIIFSIKKTFIFKKKKKKGFGELLVKISSLIQKNSTWRDIFSSDGCFLVWIQSLKLWQLWDKQQGSWENGSFLMMCWALTINQLSSFGLVKEDYKCFLII